MLFADLRESLEDSVYPWVHLPDRDGNGIIKVNQQFAWVKLPRQDFKISDSYLLRHGFPKSWDLRQAVVALDPDQQSLTAEMLANDAEDDDAEWPSEMDYEDDDGKLGPLEREFAEHYDLTPQDVAAYNFHRAITKQPAVIGDDITQILGSLAETDSFVAAVQYISLYDQTYVKRHLESMSAENRLHATHQLLKSLSEQFPSADGVHGVLLKLYLALNPDVPKPKRIKRLDGGVLVDHLISGDRWVRVFAILSKKFKLSHLLAVALGEHNRIAFLRSYLESNWERFVGLR